MTFQEERLMYGINAYNILIKYMNGKNEANLSADRQEIKKPQVNFYSEISQKIKP